MTRTLIVSVCLLGGMGRAPGVEPDVVRDDWYMRESLRAIRDWEAILARWEKATPPQTGSPVVPLPANGESVEWPNPIPRLLCPREDRGIEVRLRLVDGQLLVQRLRDGQPLKPDEKVDQASTVLGYKHPGGGGKDQWYHSYHRRFDRLTSFVGKPAPFALDVSGPFELGRGKNAVEVALRSVIDRPVEATVSLRLDLPTGSRECARQTATLAPKKTHNMHFPTDLQAEGGGIVTIRVEAEGAAYWLPLMTHVEDVSAVLASIEQILSEAPDAAAPGASGATAGLPGGTAGLSSSASNTVGQANRATLAELAALRDLAARVAASSATAGLSGGTAGLSSSASSTVGQANRATPTQANRATQSPNTVGQANRATPAAAWREVFEQASRLRDRLLLSRVKFDTLLVVKRKPFFSEQPFMDAHHLFNRPGGGIYRLSPVRPDGTLVPVVDSLGEGVYRDVCLHWDAQRLLFAFGNGCDSWDGKQSYHIYEARTDGTGLRQLSQGAKNDCEPFYLPNGQIGFTSDRSEHFVMCGGDRHSPTLFVMEWDGSAVRQLSFNVFNDFNPSVLPDGRILYGRWEYNERSVTSLHNPFTMSPDGTMVQPYYGNATIRPNVVMFPRPVPDSRKVMALFTAHHGQTHGSVGLIDVRRGIDGDGPLELLTPRVPVTGEKAEDSTYGWFSDPMPLGEDTWLCSYTPTVLPWLERSWAIYVADRHANLALVYRDPAISCAEPVPLVARPRPHVLPKAPPQTDSTTAEATLVLADVHRGLTGVARGTARHLRILEDLPRKSVHKGGVICTSGTLIFTIKRVFGTVPIEPDGSAHFIVPANRNVYFEVLDENHQEIQRMRSVVCLKPGERRGCVGCHEGRHQAPPAARFSAAHRAPSRPQPPPWGTETVSYLRDIQPLINAKCASCHTHDRAANKVILTDDLTGQFTVAYEELLPYLTVAISNRWDHPDDVLPRLPYTYGSKVSPLVKLLASGGTAGSSSSAQSTVGQANRATQVQLPGAGHYGVKLTDEEWQRLLVWIDCNGVYYDRYEAEHWPNRHIFAGPMQEAAQKIVARRCGNCHGSDDGRQDTWWLSLNRRDVRLSRALAAPLATAAGGWGRCEATVFADATDPDYQALSGLLSGVRDRLQKYPREDLRSIAGTDAERQPLAIPSPPPRSPSKVEVIPKDWVYLSDLPWESARAGWTRNGDGLPRRDRNITDQPLRIGNKKYPKGIGTHAPSEIVYALEGKYLRFQATAGPWERGGSVAFRVLGDDKLLFDSGVLHARNTTTVDVPLAGVRRLKLVVTDAGDGIIADSADWAAARLQKAGQP